MTAVDVFFSYSHQDEALRDTLETHLSLLKREGRIRSWHDRKIVPGESWKDAIDEHLETADLILILLLVSADFLASDYCYDLEMKRALERHDAGEARVVPIILRPCDWTSSPFSALQGLPKNAKPITTWENQDEAFLDVAKGLRQMLDELRMRPDEPAYPDDETRELSEALNTLYEQRAGRISEGLETTDLDVQIRDHKRLLRKDLHLKEGDFLADDRYRLQSLLGSGGFAQVWKAYDRQSKRLVAVKVLHSQYGRDQSRRKRFFRGARQMAQLADLPGIVDVFEEKCKEGGFHFFVMEYVVGGDFRQAVLEGRLSRDERLQVILEVGGTLQDAHDRGIVHRDVKPANILLDRNGRSKLTDFDLVRAADTSGGTRTSKLGTFIYAAPEAMIDASRASVPADVYGLGMTAIFALYGADLPAEAFLERRDFMEELEITDELRKVVARGAARKIERRFATVGAFCQALERLGRVDESAGSKLLKPRDVSPPVAEKPKVDVAPSSIPERVHEKDGSQLVFVPGGNYRLGHGDAVHEVELRGFWIGKYPVTNEQYGRFLNATDHRKPSYWKHERFKQPNQPVVGVDWQDARAYCEWADLELPSEAQWEAAARGSDGRRYPWGNEEPKKDLADFGKDWNSGKPDPVGSHPNGVGPFGTHDQAGGVWEWCEDGWNPYAYDGRDGRLDPVEPVGESVARVVRGGSWSDPAEFLPSALREWGRAGVRGDNLGFRVVCRSGPE